MEQISKTKATIDYTGKTAHVLQKLHAEFQKQVNLIIKQDGISKSIQKEFNKRNTTLNSFRSLFDKLDNWSYAFRYPVQNDGVTKSFNKGDEINIADIIPVYRETQIILKYTVDVLLDPASKS